MIHFFLNIINGKVDNRPQVSKVFKELEDGKYMVKINIYKKRSLPQNAYYHACVLPMVMEGLRDVGYCEVKTVEDAHEIVKHMFIKKVVKNETNGDEITIAGSTTELSTVEFIAFIDEIIMWAAQYLNIQIPLPNEQLELINNY